MGGPLVILLHGEGWHARWLAVSLALTAAASGDRVELALFGAALRAWVEGRFDEGAPREADGARVGSLAGMLEEGRRDLGLRLVACDTAVRLAGLDPGLAAARLTLTSIPALWGEAREGRLVAF